MMWRGGPLGRAPTPRPPTARALRRPAPAHRRLRACVRRSRAASRGALLRPRVHRRDRRSRSGVRSPSTENTSPIPPVLARSLPLDWSGGPRADLLIRVAAMKPPVRALVNAARPWRRMSLSESDERQRVLPRRITRSHPRADRILIGHDRPFSEPSGSCRRLLALNSARGQRCRDRRARGRDVHAQPPRAAAHSSGSARPPAPTSVD